MACAGIDLSLTSPAICIFVGDEVFNVESCVFKYMTDSTKKMLNCYQFSGTIIPPHANQYERYENISSWAIEILNGYAVSHAFIEDYSYASTGRIFHIAENTGILKYLLWKNNIGMTLLPPTVIKKTSTGKGNANKEMMQNAFINETGIDLKGMLSLSDKQWNPSSDIIDSYFICKHGFYEYEKHSS